MIPTIPQVFVVSCDAIDGCIHLQSEMRCWCMVCN